MGMATYCCYPYSLLLLLLLFYSIVIVTVLYCYCIAIIIVIVISRYPTMQKFCSLTPVIFIVLLLCLCLCQVCSMHYVLFCSACMHDYPTFARTFVIRFVLLGEERGGEEDVIRFGGRGRMEDGVMQN